MASPKSLKPSRRSFLKLAASTAVAPAVIPATSWAQRKTLVFYNFDGVIGRAFTEQVIPRFEQKFGARVETITMQGSVPPMPKIKAMVEAGRPDADVIPMQLTDYVFARRNNLVIPIGRNEIAEYKNLYPQFITDHGPGLLTWSYGLAYNTRHIKEAPTSWRDLWNPAHKGKVAINDAIIEHALQMVNLTFTGKTMPVNDATFARLTELRPNLLTLYATGAQAEQLMRREEIWMAAVWNSRAAAVQDEGVPIRFIAPKEGVFVRYNPFCIPRGARDPDLAKEWINFVCEKESQGLLAEKGYSGSPNKDVVYSDHIKSRLIVTDPEVIRRSIPEDFDAIVDNVAEWRRRWDGWKQG